MWERADKRPMRGSSSSLWDFDRRLTLRGVGRSDCGHYMCTAHYELLVDASHSDEPSTTKHAHQTSVTVELRVRGGYTTHLDTQSHVRGRQIREGAKTPKGIFTSPRVCLSFCLHISNTTSPNFTEFIFCTCYMWPSLGPPLTTKQYFRFRG